MDGMELLMTRCSVRKFTDEVISDTTIRQILEVANCAPSANNNRPWRFVIVSDPDIRQQISEVNPNWRPVKEAQSCIVVIADISQYRSRHKEFFIEDCAACTENLLLAAHVSGLGAVWLGCYPDENRVNAVRDLLSIPKEPAVIPFSVVALGFPAEEMRIKPALPDEWISVNRYGSR